jgi:hypothetical protein
MKVYRVEVCGEENPRLFWFTDKTKAKKCVTDWKKEMKKDFPDRMWEVYLREYSIDISKKGILNFLNNHVSEGPC